MAAEVLVGTQGWNYPAWVGPFYPTGTRPEDRLCLYTRAFRTVEVDATFFGPPAASIVASWRDSAPPGFQFALKVPQGITHERRLRETEAPMSHFLSRASLLGDRLGVLLLQMPPDWAPTFAAREDLERFLVALPTGLRWALEFRDPRWIEPAVVDLVRGHGVAIVCADARWIRRDRVLSALAQPTAPFAYVRWMGLNGRITDHSRVQVDRDAELDAWAEALRALSARVTTIYGYVSNRFQGHAPASARRLQTALGLGPVEPSTLRAPGELLK